MSAGVRTLDPMLTPVLTPDLSCELPCHLMLDAQPAKSLSLQLCVDADTLLVTSAAAPPACDEFMTAR
jgi:hypothetical protein